MRSATCYVSIHYCDPKSKFKHQFKVLKDVNGKGTKEICFSRKKVRQFEEEKKNMCSQSDNGSLIRFDTVA